MNIIDKLNEIDEHFNNISVEEYQKALIKAGYGYGIIKSWEESGVELKEILKEEK